MAVETSPAFIQANTYSAEITRRGVYSPMLQRGSTIGSVVGGILGSGDLLVTYGGSGLNLSVAAGECIVPGSSSTVQGGYYLRGSSATTLTPAAASASNPRVDLVYAQVQDAAYSGATNLGTIAIATGTPAGGASLGNLTGAPSLPASSLALAYVLIPQSATTINNTDIQNLNALGAAANAQGSTSFAAAGLNSFKMIFYGGGSGAIGNGQHVLASAGSTITLPAPSPNARCKVTNYQGGVCTVAQHVSEVIYGWGLGSSGAANFPLGAYGATATVESDGTNWFVTAGMQDSGWQAFSYTNSWSDTGGTTPARYRLTGNVVRFKGSVTPGSASNNFATLPAGYRPGQLAFFAVALSGATTFSCVDVGTNGVCTANAGLTQTSLDGLTFTVD